MMFAKVCSVQGESSREIHSASPAWSWSWSRETRLCGDEGAVVLMAAPTVGGARPWACRGADRGTGPDHRPRLRAPQDVQEAGPRRRGRRRGRRYRSRPTRWSPCGRCSCSPRIHASRLDGHAKEMNTARCIPQRTNTTIIMYINPICKSEWRRPSSVGPSRRPDASRELARLLVYRVRASRCPLGGRGSRLTVLRRDLLLVWSHDKAQALVRSGERSVVRVRSGR